MVLLIFSVVGAISGTLKLTHSFGVAGQHARSAAFHCFLANAALHVLLPPLRNYFLAHGLSLRFLGLVQFVAELLIGVLIVRAHVNLYGNAFAAPPSSETAVSRKSSSNVNEPASKPDVAVERQGVTKRDPLNGVGRDNPLLAGFEFILGLVFALATISSRACRRVVCALDDVTIREIGKIATEAAHHVNEVRFRGVWRRGVWSNRGMVYSFLANKGRAASHVREHFIRKGEFLTAGEVADHLIGTQGLEARTQLRRE